METHSGLMDAIDALQAQSSTSSSSSPADMFVSSSLKNLVDQFGLHRISSSHNALYGVEGFNFEFGVLSDLG